MLQTRNDNLEKNETELTNGLADLRKQLDTVQGQKINVESELHQLQQTLEASKKEVADANTQIATLRKELANSEFQITTLTQELTKKNKEIDALKVDATENNHEINSLANQVSDLKTKLASAQEDFQTDLDNLDEELAQMTTHNHDLQDALNTVKKENQILQSTLLASRTASSSSSSSPSSFSFAGTASPVQPLRVKPLTTDQLRKMFTEQADEVRKLPEYKQYLATQRNVDPSFADDEQAIDGFLQDGENVQNTFVSYALNKSTNNSAVGRLRMEVNNTWFNLLKQADRNKLIDNLRKQYYTADNGFFVLDPETRDSPLSALLGGKLAAQNLNDAAQLSYLIYREARDILQNHIKKNPSTTPLPDMQNIINNINDDGTIKTTQVNTTGNESPSINNDQIIEVLEEALKNI